MQVAGKVGVVSYNRIPCTGYFSKLARLGRPSWIIVYRNLGRRNFGEVRIMKKIFPLYLVLAFFMASVAFPAVGMAASFPDTTGHWAEEYIISLANAGYISGYPDGTFKPDKVVSRAEFVTVLVQCMGSSPGTGSSGFADTSRHWAKGYIAQAVALGILIPEEYPTGLSPDGGIKRSECAAMLVRALGNNQITAPCLLPTKKRLIAPCTVAT